MSYKTASVNGRDVWFFGNGAEFFWTRSPAFPTSPAADQIFYCPREGNKFPRLERIVAGAQSAAGLASPATRRCVGFWSGQVEWEEKGRRALTVAPTV